MENKRIVKVGNVELYYEEAMKLYEEKKYILTYSRIYQIHYSQAQNAFYGTEVFYQKGLCKRGRFHVFNASDINNLLGYNLLS